VETRRGGEGQREHPHAAQGDVTISRATTREEGLPGDPVRGAGHPVNQHHNAARPRGDGPSNATAQDLSRHGKTTDTVSAWHNVSPGTTPCTSVVINEGVVRRVVGGSEVMRDQLHHLAKTSELPHVTLRVLPFTVLEFPDLGDPRIVYLDWITDSDFRTGLREVAAYRYTHERRRPHCPRTSPAR
jgi:hypothetical protein